MAKAPASKSGSTEPIVARVLVLAALWCFLALTTSLLVIAVAFTSEFSLVQGQIIPDYITAQSFLTGAGDKVVASVVMCIVCVALMVLITRLAGKLPDPALIAITCAWSLAVQLIWIALLGAQSYYYIDSMHVSDLAQSLLAGDTQTFSKPFADEAMPYLEMYPFQSGSVFALAAVYAVAGSGNVLAVQVVNAIFNTVALMSLCAVARMAFPTKKIMPAFLAVSVLCLPLFFSCTLVYGNSAALGLCCAAMAVQMMSMRARARNASYGLSVLSFALVALACFVKSTSVLVLIPMVVVWLVYSIAHKRVALILIVIACAVGAYSCSGIAIRALEGQTGAIFGDGMPKSLWIGLGLQEGTEGLNADGWWSSWAFDQWAQADYDSAHASAAGSAAIADRIGWFASHPDDARAFFAEKLATEWSEPSFQSLYYSSLSKPEVGSLAAKIVATDTPEHAAVRAIMDGYENVVFILALIGIIGLLGRGARRDLATAVVPVCILAGFIVYVLWEAKSIYVLPYFVMMLPFAAGGLRTMVTTAHTGRHARSKSASAAPNIARGTAS